VLAQAGVKYVILALGVNDILFPGAFIPATESVTAQDVIAGNRQLIARAHQKGIRAIGTTIPPFEKAIFRQPFFDRFYTPDHEKTRQAVNAWIRSSGEFDGVIDFDAAVRDPAQPTRLLPAYDSGDHLHVTTREMLPRGTRFRLRCFARSPLPGLDESTIVGHRSPIVGESSPPVEQTSGRPERRRDDGVTL
jgi:hypothetical protein